MSESTQQLIALVIVAIAIGFELLRRYRKKKAGKQGCDGCDAPGGNKPGSQGETPVKFYKKR
jgi:hypothetical protein